MAGGRACCNRRCGPGVKNATSGKRVALSWNPDVHGIYGQRSGRIASGKQDLPIGGITAFAQLPAQPCFLEPGGAQVGAHQHAVQNHIAQQRLLLRMDTEIGRLCRALRGSGQKAHRPIAFHDGDADRRRVEIPGSAAKRQKIGQVEARLFQRVTINLPIAHQQDWPAREETPQTHRLARPYRYQEGQHTVYHHRQQRMVRRFQLRGHLGGDRTDRNAHNIVEHRHLRDLLVARELCQQEQRNGGGKCRSDNFKEIQPHVLSMAKAGADMRRDAPCVPGFGAVY